MQARRRSCQTGQRDFSVGTVAATTSALATTLQTLATKIMGSLAANGSAFSTSPQRHSQLPMGQQHSDYSCQQVSKASYSNPSCQGVCVIHATHCNPALHSSCTLRRTSGDDAEKKSGCRELAGLLWSCNADAHHEGT